MLTDSISLLDVVFVSLAIFGGGLIVFAIFRFATRRTRTGSRFTGFPHMPNANTNLGLNHANDLIELPDQPPHSRSLISESDSILEIEPQRSSPTCEA